MAREKRGQVWVLDTETKGTGAEMVPLEKLLRQKRRQNRAEPIAVVRMRPAPEPESAVEVTEAPSAEEQRPRRFRLVNVIRDQLVAEDVGAREIVSLLEDVRSVADVHIYVWHPDEDRWRPLTFGEKQVFWGFRSDNARRSWDGRDRDARSGETGARSDRHDSNSDRKGASRAASAARLWHAGRVRPRLGRAPRSRPGGNR
jgi:hypothetical protein